MKSNGFPHALALMIVCLHFCSFAQQNDSVPELHFPHESYVKSEIGILRYWPNSTAKEIITIPKFGKITILRKSAGSFFKVAYNGREGYIDKNYIALPGNKDADEGYRKDSIIEAGKNSYHRNGAIGPQRDQCLIENLFPIYHGMTKFRAINSLNLQENVYDIKDYLNFWAKKDYLNGDSVNISQVNFKYKEHGCIGGFDNIVLITFADDKLYQIHLKIWFSPNQYRSCLENYDQLVQSLKGQFPVYEKFVTNNSSTGEQVGEGCWLRKSEFDISNLKIQRISISYEIEYEWNYQSKQAYRTGKIASYLLHVEFTNLEGTKLDGRGY